MHSLYGHFLVLALFINNKDCLRSDYKRLLLSDFVKNEINRTFNSYMEDVNRDNGSVEIKNLYKEYLAQHGDFSLNRVQPEHVIGSKRNITLKGNRKEWLTLETISKRRPLILQIDDFLFDDECDHLIELAKQKELEDSLTQGGSWQKVGLHSQLYDIIGELEFEECDLDGNNFIDVTELRQLFRLQFDNKMGLVMLNEVMRKTYMDFNLDGKIEKWEWKSKNLTRLVLMLNESRSHNPASKARYSRQQWLDHSDDSDPILHSLQDRLHQLTGLPLPMLKNSEPLQVVRYQPGGHYDCHLDSDIRYYPDNYSPCCHIIRNSESNENQGKECSACRFMTVLYYLDDTSSGGETAFPVVGVDPYLNDLVEENLSSSKDWCDLSVHCELAKVKVKPKKGRAVLWYNHFIQPDTNWTGPVDDNSLHGGCAVNEGVKWIANNWINVGFDKKLDILSWVRSEVRRRRSEVEEKNNTK